MLVGEFMRALSPSLVLVLGGIALLSGCSDAARPTPREIGDDGAGGAREAGATGGHTSTGGCMLHSGLALPAYCSVHSSDCEPLGELECEAGPGQHPGASVVRGCGFVRFTIEDGSGNTWVYTYEETTGRLVYHRWDGADCQFNVALDTTVALACSAWTPSTCAAAQSAIVRAGAR